MAAFVERRDYKALEWKPHYNTYYERNWKRETKCHLNALCQCNTKKHLQQRCKCHANWNWHLHHIHDQTKDIPKLTGHTSCDIGDTFITIGGRRKSDIIDVWKVSKDFAHYKKLQTSGQVPSNRFAHTSNYIPPLNAILVFGGFDSKKNYNDARLLRLDDLTWYTLVYNTNIDYRAHHCSATRIIYDHNSQQNVFQCYIFGGQFCDGGPYVYHNTLFMFQFHCSGYFDVTEIRSDTPSEMLPPRSQRPIFAPLPRGITAKAFTIFEVRKPCYFDRQLDQIIVIHHGELSNIQKRYVQYSDTIYEFEQRMIRHMNAIVENKHKQSLYKRGRCRVFSFSLQEKRWDIMKNSQTPYDPPFIKLTCFVRVGAYLVMMGGGDRKKVFDLSTLHMLKIPQHRMMITVSWSRERLLWIGHYKRSQQCLLYKCPKHIIGHIVDFLNTTLKQTQLSCDRNDMSYQTYLQEMDNYSSPEPQLISNVVLMETPTATGNDIENNKSQNNVITLMGITSCNDVGTESMSNRSAETLMGFTSSTKH
eukprot:625218_1